MPPFLPPIAARALNALLARETWARDRLRPHAGKTVRVCAAGLELGLGIGPDGALAPSQAPANVSVRIEGNDVSRLLTGDPAGRMQGVHIAGEAALAQVVSDLARDLRWDAEDDLAAAIGDVPARALSRFAQTLIGALREGSLRLAQNVSEYAVHEAGLLAAPASVSAWASEVAALDDAARALEARVHALARATGVR